jgi:hypothetical protein
MSVPNPAAAPLPPIAAEDLPDDSATLKRMVLELLASLHQRDRDNEALRHRGGVEFLVPRVDIHEVVCLELP